LISLKKYLDMETPAPVAAPAPADLLPVLLQCYAAALQAAAKSGVKACPTIGGELQQGLAQLSASVAGTMTPPQMLETETQVEAQLDKWGGRCADYFKAKAGEVKELLIAMARTAESMGERDHRYTSQLKQFTTQLQTIANLEDLGQVRASLVRKANEMKTCVDKMAEESKKSVASLQAEVSTYETKLHAAEQLAMQDALTGLANRRNMEDRIEAAIAKKSAFCVALFDLNRFKQINDTHGHLAGDDLLKQFAQEMRSHFRGNDTVGRWGGDEFLALLDGNLAGAQSRIEQAQKWVFGDYTIQLDANKKTMKTRVDASVGVVQWHVGETLQQLVHRADGAMYKDKETTKQQKTKQ